jgi:hypothetical protein
MSLDETGQEALTDSSWPGWMLLEPEDEKELGATVLLVHAKPSIVTLGP